MLVSIGGVSRPRHNFTREKRGLFKENNTTSVVSAAHCVKHETENRHVWAFLVDEDNNDDEQGRMQWVVTDEKPEKVGRDASLDVVGGRLHVEIKVKEVFTDVSDLLEAERDNGFNSWKRDRRPDVSQYSFDRSFS